MDFIEPLVCSLCGTESRNERLCTGETDSRFGERRGTVFGNTTTNGIGSIVVTTESVAAIVTDAVTIFVACRTIWEVFDTIVAIAVAVRFACGVVLIGTLDNRARWR